MQLLIPLIRGTIKTYSYMYHIYKKNEAFPCCIYKEIKIEIGSFEKHFAKTAE